MNEIINILLFFISMLFSVYFYNLCYAKLTNQKLKITQKNIFYMIITAILIMLNVSYNLIGIKIMVNFIIYYIEMKLLFKNNTKEIIVNYIFIYLILNLVELMVTNIFLFFELLNNSQSANSLTFANMTLTILVQVIGYLLIANKRINILLKKLITFFIENKTQTNIVYLIFITTAVINVINIKNFANNESIQLLFMLLIIFITLFVTIIRLKYNEEVLKVSNKKLIDYNDKYGKFLDEYKIYKHNINHKLSAMKSFGNKKINALIDDLLEEETSFSIRNNEIYNVPNGIKGIVAEKLYNKNYNVIINNDIKNDPFDKLSAKAFHSLSESLGIVLDNAIEASEETKSPIIVMDLYEDKEFTYIKVGNNFCNEIDFDKLGEKYYSTKNRGSGLGLFSIMRNSLVKEKISIINDFYYIELQIKKAR